jgi:hypothetical protein
MTVHFHHHRRIELSSQAHTEAWASEFGVSVPSLLTAINTVGNDASAVGRYLEAFREPMGAYVDTVRARLDEIEVQVEKLNEERRSIVSFLEGFAQLQRTQRNQGMHANASAASEGVYAVVVTDDAAARRDGQNHRIDDATARHIYRGPAGSSSEILDTVHRLLADGQRRSLQEILMFLEVRGITAKGSNRAAFLSTLLSRDERFDPNRRDGWGLKGRP